MQDTDVLIVGGGPTGTMLALELAAQKVSFRIIDKELIRSDKSRALIVQPRTQELLNRHGAAHDLVARGKLARGARMMVNRKEAMCISLDDLGVTDTEFTLPLAISQFETEDFLDSCLTKYGNTVERGVEATDVVQDESGVTVTLKKNVGESKGSETIRAKYVVGCDGAHSVVRHAAKALTFEGAPYPQSFILCDCYLSDTNLILDRLIFCLDYGFCAIFPLTEGKIRIIVARPGGVDKEEPVLEDFASVFEQFTPPGSGRLHDPVWMTRFHLHHRGVNKYREGRLFVVGDAAHIHSPAGGQGMNTGMQDAINLGWKLASVLRGEKDGDFFLDSYNNERWPIGQALLKGSDSLFTYATSPNAFVACARSFLLRWVVPWIISSSSLRGYLFNFTSEFGINYRASPLVGTAKGFKGSIRGGDRLSDGRLQEIGGSETSLQRLCDATCYHLCLFSGIGKDTAIEEVLQQAQQIVIDAARVRTKVHIIQTTDGNTGYLDVDGSLHKRYGLERSGYVWVRPDAYVGHIGTLGSLDELVQLLKEIH